ncbi:MAG: PhoH family protein [Chitinophagaceae bacterium]|nr:PhoH family protein [Chitinophagaceae bacterium]
MLEKVITLEDNISLVHFLGAENKNISTLVESFPKTKIISRGNEIFIKGEYLEISKVNEIINALIQHYNTYGIVTEQDIDTIIKKPGDLHEKKEEFVLLYGNKGSKIIPRTPHQIELVEKSKKNDLVFAIGPAGCGKTYISVALALQSLKNNEVRKIIITRPAVEAGENLGFLPGDMKEKIDPYLKPIYDALQDMLPIEKLKFYQENNIIEIAPLAYMRGRTLNNAFILLDEAQNTTQMQIKMFLTRMGINSKIIVTGDTSQIDLPHKQKSGLLEALRILKDNTKIGFVKLDERDVLRHPLVKDIIVAYQKDSINVNPSQ